MIEEALLEALIGHIAQTHASVQSSDTSQGLTKTYQVHFDM
jgi:hypothetical protein